METAGAAGSTLPPASVQRPRSGAAAALTPRPLPGRRGAGATRHLDLAVDLPRIAAYSWASSRRSSAPATRSSCAPASGSWPASARMSTTGSGSPGCAPSGWSSASAATPDRSSSGQGAGPGGGAVPADRRPRRGRPVAVGVAPADPEQGGGRRLRADRVRRDLSRGGGAALSRPLPRPLRELPVPVYAIPATTTGTTAPSRAS